MSTTATDEHKRVIEKFAATMRGLPSHAWEHVKRYCEEIGPDAGPSLYNAAELARLMKSGNSLQ